jgi:hypothetical protein
VRNDRLGQLERAEHVDRERRAPPLDVESVEPAPVLLGEGVVHEDIDAAEPGCGLGQTTALVGVTDVGGHAHHPPAQRLDLLSHRLQRGIRPRPEHDVGSRACERERDVAPHARSDARHDRDPSLQQHGRGDYGVRDAGIRRPVTVMKRMRVMAST